MSGTIAHATLLDPSRTEAALPTLQWGWLRAIVRGVPLGIAAGSERDLSIVARQISSIERTYSFRSHEFVGCGSTKQTPGSYGNILVLVQKFAERVSANEMLAYDTASTVGSSAH